MTYGLTPAGFNRKTFQVLKQEIGDYWKAKISPKLDLDSERTVCSNLLHPVATSLAELWEVEEARANALDVNNVTAESATPLGAMVGVSPYPDRAGTVNTICDLDAGVYAAGSLVAHVQGEPTNLWENRTSATSTGGATPVVFISQGVGASVRAPANTLNAIAASVSGWNSINNPSDDGEGLNAETPAELMIRRAIALASEATTTVGGLKAAVLAVSGVQQAQVFTNRNSYAVDGIPPHSHRVVVYDGDTEDAADDEIAQAIFDHQADGVRSYGSLSGTATDDDGDTTLEYFDRSVPQELYAAVEVESSGVDIVALKQAMSDFVSGTLGERVVYAKLSSAITAVPGVIDVLALTIDSVDPPVGVVNIAVSADTRNSLLTANIDVTVTPP